MDNVLNKVFISNIHNKKVKLQIYNNIYTSLLAICFGRINDLLL